MWKAERRRRAGREAEYAECIEAIIAGLELRETPELKGGTERGRALEASVRVKPVGSTVRLILWDWHDITAHLPLGGP